MIIQSLKAENVLKYANLSITDLPAACMIGVRGSNESGKSAIMETLCLALFGRTHALPPEQTAKAVRWGTVEASTEVRFTGLDGREYVLGRYFSSDGRRRARLERIGGKRALAKGENRVAGVLKKVTGFDYAHYTDVVYLAQHEWAGERVHGATVKALAGVDVLEREADGFGAEIARAEAGMADAKAERAENRANLEALEIDPEALGDLQSALDETDNGLTALDREEAQWNAFAAALDRAAAQTDQAVNGLSEGGIQTSLSGWRDKVSTLEEALNQTDSVCHNAEVEMDYHPTTALKEWAAKFGKRLEGFSAILEEMGGKTQWLAAWLGEGEAPRVLEGETTLAQEREAIQGRLKKAKRKKRFASWVGRLFLLLGAAGGVPWALVRFAPDLPQTGQALDWLKANAYPHLAPHAEPVQALLTANVPQWPDLPEPLLLIWAAPMLLLWLLFAFRSMRKGGGVRKAMHKVHALDGKEGEARKRFQTLTGISGQTLPVQVKTLVGLGEEAPQGLITSWGQGKGRVFLDPGALSDALKEAGELLAGYQGDIRRVHEDLDGLREEIGERRGASEESREELLEEIREEEARREEARGYEAVLEKLDGELVAKEAAVAAQRVAQELLMGTCRGLSVRFNQEIRRLLTDAAPRFTEGRYSRLRIGDNLDVEAFSTEKNDFVNLDEVSRGTQHQLMLALRVALAQTQLAGEETAGQFLALDEPFAFFDRNRVAAALAALPEINPRISQFWIVGQSFNQPENFDFVIDCSSESDRIEIDAGKRAPKVETFPEAMATPLGGEEPG